MKHAFARIVQALFYLASLARALSYDTEQVRWNLNQNQSAGRPQDYWGEWDDHTFFPSPKNWRFPFYLLTQDRFADGDPSNNEANGTVFEHDWTSNQFRFGGDLRGAMTSLDYIQGMGIKGIYISGSPFLNFPWAGDGYGPLDFTLLDHHAGDIEIWRAFITEVHARGMYVVMDNTVSTMTDLLGMAGLVNSTVPAPFNWGEYDYVWKSDRRYLDFHPGNEVNESCEYPRMWGQDGFPLAQEYLDQEKGCRISDFDSYGEIQGIGLFTVFQTQLSKFASVQDRLREWKPDVMDRLKVMSCMQIAMLDIDGFRIDKGTQITVDALADFADYQRKCAKRFGKDNFLMVGEIVATSEEAAIFVGRGKQPDQVFDNLTNAFVATGTSDPASYLRDFGLSALDGSAFQYDIYGAMTRFLGMDGPWGSKGVDFVQQWNLLLASNDMVNAITGEFDPRNFMGVTSQDVFRWPALSDGAERQFLGLFITTLELPGVPIIMFGEEQGSGILENLAPNYVFGRMPMASQRAWQLHGCYTVGETTYVNMPWNNSDYCHDMSYSLDHRDPSHPLRNILKRMWELRQQYPTLNDGVNVTTLSTKLYNIYLPGSDGLPSPTGLWSVLRARQLGVQDLSGQGQGNLPVWLVYHNENRTMTYEFDCSSNNRSTALVSAFASATVVKNLLYPYDEYTLAPSQFHLSVEGSTESNGCLAQLTMDPWGYKAFVPIDQWEAPAPTITQFMPGHDARLISTVPLGQHESVPIELFFSMEMDCDAVTRAVQLGSTTSDGSVAQLNASSVTCSTLTGQTSRYVAAPVNEWSWSAQLDNVANGVHTVTVDNASTAQLTYTNAVDKFMFRIGQVDNPVVFPWTGNYSSNVLHQNASTGDLYLTMRAPGATLYRYSTNYGSSYSPWQNYTNASTIITPLPWSGTKDQEWEGTHVILNFWSDVIASADHVQHADLDRQGLKPRRWPHAWIQGAFNQYGYDAGLSDKMSFDEEDGMWTFDLVTEFPSNFLVNVWGMNPDGYPDKSMSYGDVDGDGVLDRLPPDTLAAVIVNVSKPSQSYIGHRIKVNDGNLRYYVSPVGHSWIQVVLGILIAVVPLLTGILGVYIFTAAFYKVKFNEVGAKMKSGMLPFSRGQQKLPTQAVLPHQHKSIRDAIAGFFHDDKVMTTSPGVAPSDSGLVREDHLAAATAVEMGLAPRRTVLIATMEYNITDWNISVKIGGLGVMAGLMGKNLGHQNLIWVVPCVAGIEYPIDQPADPMEVTILGKDYQVNVQYHVVANITYVLLDAPVFRKRTKAEPYPPRMDDLDSAIYYSSWNQCIAQTYQRFPIDLYHINDYHGTIAPLYLLPRTIPVCFSLHNAEFQGLWTIRKPEEKKEISGVFNLPTKVVEKYVQFGEVFNLLHAGSAYLRLHQKGYGAVGVSNKYGRRAWARYPIFWGLHSIGDTGPWDKQLAKTEEIFVQEDVEAERGALRREAQEWAGLEVDPDAELFVFVGRWSVQKGIDLIADVFFSVLEKNPRAQLICIGPVIDLYGKFAALKLEKLMHLFPGRVFSKPEFTALPPCVFTGAEFALIPSRDEPFGLVGVEFGRKGALGVGARVGGLGQMPGWWYTVESTTTQHLLHQFKLAIAAALSSKKEMRALMRARAAKQRFPVAQWVEDLEKLQTTSIKIAANQVYRSTKKAKLGSAASTPWMSPLGSPIGSPLGSPIHSAFNSPPTSPIPSRLPSPYPSQPGSRAHSRAVSLDLVRSVTPEQGIDAIVAMDTSPEMAAPVPGINGISVRHLDDIRRGRLASQSFDALRSQATGKPMSTPPSRFASRRNSITDGDAHARAGLGIGSSIRRPGTPTSEIDASQGTFPNSPVHGHSASSSRSNVPHIAWSPTESNAQTSSAASTAGPPLPMLDRETIKPEGEAKEYNMQRVDPFFNDPTGLYYRTYDDLLNKVDAKTSEGSLSIEAFLVKSEKDWFSRFHSAKMGKSVEVSTRALKSQTSMYSLRSKASTLFNSPSISQAPTLRGSDSIADLVTQKDNSREQFEIDVDYIEPNSLKKFMQHKIFGGDWQVYTIFMAFGQILAINSYQVTLLTGEIGQPASKLYALASIYLASSLCWWTLYRLIPSVYILALPFFFYGLAFFLIGFGPLTSGGSSYAWVNNVGTAFYSVGSASGSLFFATNFGTEGGSPVKTWVYRACLIQGTQQVFVAGLWWWGSVLTSLSDTGIAKPLVTSTPTLLAITTPIAVLLWATGIILYLGLPSYYHQTPGKVPNLFMAVWRRKIVLWFFVAVIIQNYFLSTPYGRNWRYLWSSQHAPRWAIAILVLVFFIGVWALVMWVLHNMSKKHSWILPIFAVSLGAPRFLQMLWGVGGNGTYVPWGGPVCGALLARSLWLWLGVLDAVQGVGFGMILLQTLTRYYIVFALTAAQVIGSVATILARATAPDNVGPGLVFPNFTLFPEHAASQAWFWVVMILQLVICVGFFVFFRKEQLFKP